MAAPSDDSSRYGSLRTQHGASDLSYSNSVATHLSRGASPSPSSAQSFSRGLFRSTSRSSGYHRLEGDHELARFGDSNQSTGGITSSSIASSASTERGLGISGFRNSAHFPISRSPPDTPRSYQALIDNTALEFPMVDVPPSVPPAVRATGYLSPDMARSGTMSPDSQDGANWAPSMPNSGHANAQGPTNSRGILRSGQSSPGMDSDEGTNMPKMQIAPDDDFDDDVFYSKFREPPSNCWSNQDIHQKRSSWLSITIYVLSLYSTILSGIWLVTSILQPRWGRQISSKQGLLPSTATTLTALLAKTIEMSFVTVFVSFLGQVLTRRSFIRKAQGVSLAEMTMRNWVIQPGSLITHFETLPSSALTLLGMLSLTATIAASFYTTASDAMVAPKLKNGKWQHQELSGYVKTSYANAAYIREDCPYLFDMSEDFAAQESCMNIQFSGSSYKTLYGFMQTYTNLKQNGTVLPNDISKRPYGTMMLYDNTTLYGSWIETSHSNITAQYEKSNRIINNVTMAMPHPGVYAAATNPINNILQPDELSGVGEYSVRAGVVSPVINVMCVNVGRDEIAPLIYTQWPNALVNETGVGNQTVGWSGWQGDVPPPTNDTGSANYLNSTELDDVFRWGSKYERRPPVFQLYPSDYNLLTNASVYASDATYMLGKTINMTDYTLCELRSWTSPNCSTQFNISGTTGSNMKAHCEDPDDVDNYLRSFPEGIEWSTPSLDFKWLADQWRLSMDLNGGATNVNASNARIITQLALREPKLPTNMPSMAEALAVYISSMIVVSAIDTPFRHYWDWDDPNNIVTGGPGHLQAFNASLVTQQYTSGHIDNWQNIFYVVLVLVFGINLFCLFYFIMRSGLVTDFTEPQNLFALAVNSPPSTQLNGSCGGGPEKQHLEVPWRVAYAHSANHYFFEEVHGGAPTSKLATETVCTGSQPVDTRNSSYKRLSTSQGWL